MRSSSEINLVAPHRLQRGFNPLKKAPSICCDASPQTWQVTSIPKATMAGYVDDSGVRVVIGVELSLAVPVQAGKAVTSPAITNSLVPIMPEPWRPSP